MKKTFTLLAIAVFTVTIAQAQIQKGSTLLGGTIRFSSSKSNSGPNEDKRNEFSFAPSVATFYQTNRAAGISLSYRRVGFLNDDFTQNYYGAGIFFRQYLPLAKSFYLFTHEGADFSSGKYKMYWPTPEVVEVKTSAANLNFAPGVAYGITRRLQLELGLPDLVALHYEKSSTSVSVPNGNPGSTNKEFSLKTGLNGDFFGSLSFGMRVLLN